MNELVHAWDFVSLHIPDHICVVLKPPKSLHRIIKLSIFNLMSAEKPSSLLFLQPLCKSSHFIIIFFFMFAIGSQSQYDCTFETGYCSWIQDTSNHWIRTQGTNRNGTSQPITDHTLGNSESYLLWNGKLKIYINTLKKEGSISTVLEKMCMCVYIYLLILQLLMLIQWWRYFAVVEDLNQRARE